MPIYEYRRPDGSTFEVLQSFSDAPLTHDPDSGAEVQRVLHAPAVHFKGSGFYNTDYGTRKRQRESAATDSSSDGAAAKPSEKAESSGDSKDAGGKGKSEKKPAGASSKPKSEPVAAA